MRTEAVDEALAHGTTPVIVGGTGLYLRAAVSDLELPPPPAPGVRERWDARYEELGPEGAHAELAAVDAAAAAAVHPNDRRRVVRALELAEAGASLSPERDRLWSEETRHPTLIVGLDVPREELDRRIAARTQRMLERGVVDEVREALTGDVSATAGTIHGCASSPSCRRSRLPPPTTPACAATPPTSESGCGAFRGSGWSTRTGRPARSRTRSSRSTSRRGAAAGAPPG